MLNPADTYVIGEGDEIIVLAEDDDSYYASITHTLIRDVVEDGSSRPSYIDICPGGLDAIRNFSNTWSRSCAPSLSRFGTGETFDGDVERILFCGWRFDMGNLLQVYSAVAPPGSEFWILSEHSVEERESELQLRGWDCNNRVKVVHRVGACRRNVLARLPLESFSSVIVGASELGSSHMRSSTRSKGSSEHHTPGKNSEVVGDADARVITVVMMIQDITKRRNMDTVFDDEFDQFSARNADRDEFLSTPVSAHRKQEHVGGWTPKSGMCKPSASPFSRSPSLGGCMFSGLSRARSQRFLGSKAKPDNSQTRGVIVGEIVDSRSRAMLSVVNSIDAVVASSELISKAVAMVSEDSSVNQVLNTLFDPYDSEITLESVEGYVDLARKERVSFFELMARGRQFGTIVLGYLERELVEGSPEEGSTIRYTDVKLNPAKKDLRRNWHPDDLLIVLTPGASESSMTPSEQLTDFSLANAEKDLSWNGSETLSLVKRNKVRFRVSRLTPILKP